MKILGITTTQYSILSNINKLSKCSINDLSNAMGVERTSLLRMLKPLIEENYVIEEVNKNKKYYELSKQGNQIRDDALIIWQGIQEEIENELQEDAMKLKELLNKIEMI